MALSKTYFKDIELSSYRFLSNVVPLSSYNFRDVTSSDAELSNTYRLSFKYDDELRYFLLSDDCYYYPSFNQKYPKQLGDYFDENRFNVRHQNELDFLSGIFDNTNLFVLAVDDNSIADRIGIVDISLDDESNDAIRVYEDFDDTLFDPSDPNFYTFVKFSVLCTYEDSHGLKLSAYENLSVDDDGNEFEIPVSERNTLSCIDIGSIGHREVFDMKQYELSNLPKLSTLADIGGSPEVHGPLEIAPSYTESEVVGYTTNFATIDLKRSMVDLSELLRIYINYKRAGDGGIVLYFNLINYLNSPFIRYDEERRPRVDTIDGTYLRLDPGQEGKLDIVVQFREYSNGKLKGYRNATVITYAIWNVSDDKPKFVIRKIGELAKDSLSRYNGTRLLQLDIPDFTASVDTRSTNPGSVNLQIRVVHDFDDGSIFAFDLYYPTEVLKFVPRLVRDCTVVDKEEYLHIETTRPNVDLLTIPFETVYGQNRLYEKMNGVYLFETVDETIISSQVALDIKGGAGYMSIADSVVNVLATESKSATKPGTPILTEDPAMVKFVNVVTENDGIVTKTLRQILEEFVAGIGMSGDLPENQPFKFSMETKSGKYVDKIVVTTGKAGDPELEIQNGGYVFTKASVSVSEIENSNILVKEPSEGDQFVSQLRDGFVNSLYKVNANIATRK